MNQVIINGVDIVAENEQLQKRIIELEEENNRLSKMNSRLSQGIYWGNGQQFCDVVRKLKRQLHELPKKIAMRL